MMKESSAASAEKGPCKIDVVLNGFKEIMEQVPVQ
jgi:hypothetical protein